MPEAKLELLRRADRAARAFDPRVVKVECSFAEELRELLAAFDALGGDVESETFTQADDRARYRHGAGARQ